MARKLEVEIVGDASSLNRTLKQSADSTGKFNKHLGALKYAAIGAGAAVGGALVVGLKDSISAGIEAQKSQARLAVAFKNAGKAIGPYEKQIGRAEAASRRLGFTDDEARQSLGSLITVTHNYRQAVKEMAIAQDLARFKGVSLEQATKALTMAHAGSLRAIKQLGLDVPKVTDAQDKLKAATKDHTTEAYKNALALAKQQDKAATLKNVLETVTNATKGQAKAYSDTAAGAMSQFHAQLQHIEEEVGLKLLPVMTQAIVYIRDHWPQISKVIRQAWETDIKPPLMAMIELVKSVAAVIKEHWGTIGPIVNNVKNIIHDDLKIITDILKVFAALLRGDWSGAWAAFKDAISTELDKIKNIILAYAKVGGVIWNATVSLVTNLVGAFTGAIKDMAKDVENAVTGLFHKVIGWAEHALGISSPSAVFHGIGQNAVKGFINGVGSMAGALKKAVVQIAEHAATSIFHSAGSLLHGGAATGGGRNRNIGKELAAGYGWSTGAQWANLDALWQRESGWSNTAKNKSSGAYGIAQALPPTKMPFSAQEAGGSNAAAQIAWGLSYIKSRYGSPIAAMAHEQSVGWYGKGGIFSQPTIIGVGEKGPEAVVPLGRSGGMAPIMVNLVLDGKVLASQLIDPLRGQSQIYKQRTGRQAFA